MLRSTLCLSLLFVGSRRQGAHEHDEQTHSSGPSQSPGIQNLLVFKSMLFIVKNLIHIFLIAQLQNAVAFHISFVEYDPARDPKCSDGVPAIAGKCRQVRLAPALNPSFEGVDAPLAGASASSQRMEKSESLSLVELFLYFGIFQAKKYIKTTNL